ncbi:MAG: hypothetical protein V4654_02725 [Bdellovibrionota bacterium]
MGDISISSLAAGFLFSVIGFWLFKEGRRRAEVRLALIGVTMMGYSYFTSSPAADWGIGLSLCGLAYLAWV